MDHSKPELPFYWLPKKTRILYLCADKELHEVTITIWGKWVVRKSDRMVVPTDAMLNLMFTMTPEMKGPTDAEGKPVVQ